MRQSAKRSALRAPRREPDGLKVLVCGDRNWTNWDAIWRELRKFPPGTTVIHGGCRGADSMAGYAAKRLGFNVKVYPAEWDKYGRAAGPLRNQRMLDEEKPDCVLAFHADLARSRGTADMVRRAKKADIPVVVIEG